MTVRFRRTLKVAPGVRINVTKTGVGVRVGPRGLGLSAHSSGRVTLGAGIPGTGLYYQQTGRWRAAGERGEGSIGERIEPWTDAEHAIAASHESLRSAAVADHLRGGGPDLERLWEIAYRRIEENFAALVPVRTDAVLKALDRIPYGRRELAEQLIAGRSDHDGDLVATYLWRLDNVTREPWVAVAEAHFPAAEELWAAVDATGLYRDLPFASQWYDRMFEGPDVLDRFEQVVLEGIAARICEDELDYGLTQVVGRADRQLHSVLQALQQGDTYRLRRAVEHLGAVWLTELWTDTAGDIDLPLLDGLTLSVPAGTDAAMYVLGLAVEAGAELNDDLRGQLEAADGDPVLELIRVRRRWLDGDNLGLAALDAPEPHDAVTSLTGIFIADAYQQVDRHDDAIELADRIAEVAGVGPVAAEVHLHRAWLRRAANDLRWADDVALVRQLRPDHPGLWALPDPDRPDTTRVDATELARTVAFELVRATFDVSADQAAVRADGIVLDVLATVLTADGDVSGLEAELLGRYVTADELTAEAANYAGDPARLLSAAATLDRPVPADLVDRYVGAIEQLARTAALADGQVCTDERNAVADLVSRLRAAASAGRWDNWKVGDTLPAGGRWH